MNKPRLVTRIKSLNDGSIRMGPSMETGAIAIALVMVLSLTLVMTPLAYAQTVIATVSVGTAPRDVDANTVTNKIYVTNVSSNNVSVIDGARDTVLTTVSVGTAPRAVGVNTVTNKIYVANFVSNTVSVIDGATDTVLTTVGVGSLPNGVGVNTVTNKIYVSNFGSNNVSVIDGATDTVLTTVSVGTDPFGVGVNTATNKIYVANDAVNTVSVINGATDTVVATVGVGGDPSGVAVNTVRNRIYVTNNAANTVSVIHGGTDTVVNTLAVGSGPLDVDVNTETDKVYVANNGGNTVSVIRGAGNTPLDAVVATVGVGSAPFGVGVNERTSKIYVSNTGDNTVSVIFDQPPVRSGCRTTTFTSDSKVDFRCVIRDTTPPKIVRAFVTPSDYLCVETHDNVQTARITYNGQEIPRWSGSSNGYFCTNEELPAVIKVVAEDIAGNKSEKVTIKAEEILITKIEQAFTAVIVKELNPHHGIEGIVLEAKSPIKQIRLAKSPDFNNRELHISEKGIMKLDGKQTVKVAYRGQYSNTMYGKEQYGQIYVFATNMGRIATFDVVVKDDIKLYPHKEKQRHGTYELDLLGASTLEDMNLNAWQRAELERIFASNEELTVTQKNILSLVVRLSEDL